MLGSIYGQTEDEWMVLIDVSRQHEISIRALQRLKSILLTA